MGFALDAFIGDPHRLPHPVRWIGRLISALEKRLLRENEPPGRQRWKGVLLVVCTAGITLLVTVTVLAAGYALHPVAGLVIETILCCYCLAARDLRDASMAVYRPLRKYEVLQRMEGVTDDFTADQPPDHSENQSGNRSADKPGNRFADQPEDRSADDQSGNRSAEQAADRQLEQARKAVSMIVGRDTTVLDADGIARAAVETVAENTADGVIAPLFWMILGGAPLSMGYKAVNTMDSMVGYRNDRYRYFGTAAAKLDDILGFIPARISGLLLVLAAYLTGMDGRNAWRIFRRDRYRHASPNSAQSESACAGALDLQLAGDAVYFGKTVHKPYIGDPLRSIEPEDIKRADRLMYAASVIGVVLMCAVRLLITALIR